MRRNVRRVALLGLSLLAIGVVAFLAIKPWERPRPTPRVRFDGVYQNKPGYDDDFFRYIRFFPEGLVIDVSTPGEPHKIIRWFDEHNPNVGKGRYKISGNHIEFTTTIPEVHRAPVAP